MKRQWQINHMSLSSASETLKHNFSTYSNISIPPRLQSRSKEKHMEKSRDKMYTGYQNLGQKISLNNFKSSDIGTLKEIPYYEYKQNPIRKDLDNVTQRVRELEAKFIEYQHRVDNLQRNSRNTSKLSTSLEEFMRNQYADLKERQRLEERIATFEQALGHMSTIKADRKELQNIEVGKYYGLTERINELQRQNIKVDNEIAEINGKFQRVLCKIETNLVSMGEKYEDFIESNIIKTIDHVNKLTQHYHTQIQELNKNQNVISEKVETLQNSAIHELQKSSISSNLAKEVIGVSLPGIKLIQSIVIKDERKSKTGLTNFKQHIKQQHKDFSNKFGVQNSSTSTTFSENILNNMYDSIQTTVGNTSLQISFQKIIYKIDADFNLLDENEHYILNDKGQHIRLNEKQIALLKQQGVM